MGSTKTVLTTAMLVGGRVSHRAKNDSAVPLKLNRAKKNGCSFFPWPQGIRVSRHQAKAASGYFKHRPTQHSRPFFGVFLGRPIGFPWYIPAFLVEGRHDTRGKKRVFGVGGI